MSKSYEDAVREGAVLVPGRTPPAGTMAAKQKDREDAERAKKSRGGGGGGSGCFVATAVFGHDDAPEVVFLRTFRDESLSQGVFGRGFIHVYYAISPPLAAVIAKSQALRRIVRGGFLQPVISLLRYYKRH